MSAHLWMLSFLLCVWLSACSEGRTAESEPGMTRDSAGVTIVENRTPAWTEADAWRIADTPSLDMGAAAGDPDQEFYQIRGVTRLSDGTIVVANGGSSELRYYDADGTFRTRAGRKGGGPGEFTFLSGVRRLAGDSVLASDMMQRRASIFGPDGQHVRDFALVEPGTINMRSLLGQLDDGTYIAQATNMHTGSELMDRPIGPYRDSSFVLHVDTSGKAVDTLGLFPGPRMTRRMMNLMGRKLPMPTPVAFSSAMHVAAAADRVYIGVSDAYEIGVYSPAGRLERLIHRQYEPRLVTDADVEATRARMLEAMASANQNNPIAKQMAESYANMEAADTMPAYGRFLVDGDRNLWVADYPGPNDSSAHWNVFDATGRWLGTVTIPHELVIDEIGSDYVLGRTTDDAEVEHVLLYELIKPSQSKE